MRRLWPNSTPARWLVVIVGFFVLANVAGYVTSSVRPEPSGEVGSAYATQPLGAAAYAELLRRSGHRVELERTPLPAAALDPRTTLVVLEARGLDGGERAALGRFVRAGGRLVAAGRDPAGWLGDALQRPPRWTSRGAPDARPLLPVAETRGVTSVATAARGGFADVGGALPVLGETGARGGSNDPDGTPPVRGSGPALLVIARAGAGRALLLAESSPLQNRGLARADNAALGLALAGPPQRTVVFAESVHGIGERRGLAALPGRWKIALGGIVLAGLLWLASRARRLGPPERLAPQPAPARREHVDALALALRRARDPGVALEPVRAAARAQVVRRAGLPPTAPDADVRAAALELGFDEDEADALLIGTREDGTLAVGRALAKGRR